MRCCALAAVKIISIVKLFLLIFTLSALAPSSALAIMKTVAKTAGSSDSSLSYDGIDDTVLPDLFTGAMTYSVPIKLPKGTSSQIPELRFRYNSLDTEDGILGPGWKIDGLSSIERNLPVTNTDIATTDVYTGIYSDRYVLKKDGSGAALVNIGDSTHYKEQIEAGFNLAYKGIAADGNISWSVGDKRGNYYRYGTSTSSRLYDSIYPTKVFKWYLDSITDQSNNTAITCSYETDSNNYQVYISTINYAPGITVKFNYESHGNYYPTTDLGFIAKVVTAKRLKSIEVLANNNKVTAYNIQYSYDSSLIRVQSIQQFGNDYTIDSNFNISGNTSLQPETFGYSNGMLTGISNGHGGSTSIIYGAQPSATPPSSFTNQILTSDGYIESEMDYYFEGGNSYSTSTTKEFRGYNHAKVTGPYDPGDPDAVRLIKETWFHQGNGTTAVADDPNVAVGYMKGKPYRLMTSDSTGKIYSDTIMSYEQIPENTYPSSSSYYYPLKQIEDYKCSAGSINSCSEHHTRTIFTNDSFGNVQQESRIGAPDTTSLDQDIALNSTIARTFYNRLNQGPNNVYQLRGILTKEIVYIGTGINAIQATSTDFYYDDYNANCLSGPVPPNQTPQLAILSKVVRWLDTDPANSPISIASYRSNYDGGKSKIVCTKDGNGNVITFEYDSTKTYVTTVTKKPQQSAANQISTTKYYGIDNADTGAYGQIESFTDPNSVAVNKTYDALGRLLKVTDPASQALASVGKYSHAYNDTNSAATQNRITYSPQDSATYNYLISYYDGLGRVTSTSLIGSDNPKQKNTSVTYDARGFVSKKSLPFFSGSAQQDIKYTYDVLGRVTSVTKPDQTAASTCYKSNGVTAYLDENFHLKQETKDGFGRLVLVEEFQGTFTNCSGDPGTAYARTTYSYDALGRLLSITNQKNQTTSITYDSLNRKTSIRDPDMGTWNDPIYGNISYRYKYDANNNLIWQKDAKQQEISFAYDGFNRLKTKDYNNDGIIDVTYTYDEVRTGQYNIGRLTSMADGSGSTTYNYDKLGRPTTQTKTESPLVL